MTSAESVWLQGMQIQGFHLLSGPGRLSQEFETGTQAGLIFKAINIYPLGQTSPTVNLQ